MTDLLKLISDPLLKDGIAVIAIACTGLFILLKYLLSFLLSISTNKKEPDETRIEKYFRQTIDKYEKEKVIYQEDYKKVTNELLEKSHIISKLQMQMKALKSRIKYLEYKLNENGIKITPSMDNFDE